MDRAKPFDIPKREVWEAYKRVRANQGAAGVDGQSIADFEADLSNNLYKLWNRLSSGSYFPPPVRRVDIPKDDGRTRPLGIPTVADRIAQMVVKRFLEPFVEPQFHEDSYGYRPGKSALDAVGVARQRCWRYDWVLDLDIKSFPDYALCSAIKLWYKTGTYDGFCGFERWRATRCNFKRGSARPSLLFFTEQKISAGRR
jgi:RNA-directed DNA polymerase